MTILKHIHINIVILVRDNMLVFIYILIYIIKFLTWARISICFVYNTFVTEIMLTANIFNFIILLLIIFIIVFLNTKSIISVLLVRILKMIILLFGDDIFITYRSLLLLFCLHLLFHLYFYIFLTVKYKHIKVLV